MRGSCGERSVFRWGAAALVVFSVAVLLTSRPFSPLSVGNVPVEDVELGGSHSVDDMLDEVHGKEVACRVDHQTAVGKPGGVGYGDGGVGDGAGLAGQVRERLESVDDSELCGSLNLALRGKGGEGVRSNCASV